MKKQINAKVSSLKVLSGWGAQGGPQTKRNLAGKENTCLTAKARFQREYYRRGGGGQKKNFVPCGGGKSTASPRKGGGLGR